jgi:hypothetical protein
MLRLLSATLSSLLQELCDLAASLAFCQPEAASRAEPGKSARRRVGYGSFQPSGMVPRGWNHLQVDLLKAFFSGPIEATGARGEPDPQDESPAEAGLSI